MFELRKDNASPRQKLIDKKKQKQSHQPSNQPKKKNRLMEKTGNNLMQHIIRGTMITYDLLFLCLLLTINCKC